MKGLLFILLLLPVFVKGQVRDVMAKYPIDAPSMDNLNDGILGRWKFEEDTNKNNFYEIIRRKPYALDKYHIKFWDRGGTNPSYEANMHFSKIGNALFINVPYFEGNFSHSGFFFLKVVEMSADVSKITAVVVKDKSLWQLNEAEVKQSIMNNMKKPSYYRDTVHLYKLK